MTGEPERTVSLVKHGKTEKLDFKTVEVGLTSVGFHDVGSQAHLREGWSRDSYVS